MGRRLYGRIQERKDCEERCLSWNGEDYDDDAPQAKGHGYYRKRLFLRRQRMSR